MTLNQHFFLKKKNRSVRYRPKHDVFMCGYVFELTRYKSWACIRVACSTSRVTPWTKLDIKPCKLMTYIIFRIVLQQNIE